MNDRFRALFNQRGTISIGDEIEPQRRGLVISLCFLTASLLWFVFSLQETYTQVIELPTSVTRLPDGMALTELPPSSVRVQVEGEGVQLLRLHYNPPTLLLTIGEGEVDMQPAAQEAIKNVSLQSVTPRTVQIVTEPIEWVRVPVDARIQLQLQPGHRILPPARVRPDSVTVSGAQSIVRNLRSWPTERRTIGGVGDTVSVMLALSDSLAGLISLDASAIQYFADVQEFTEARRIVDVRVTDIPAGQDVSLDPSRVELTYQIPVAQFDRAMESDDLYLEVPYRAIRDDETGMVVPFLHTPPGLNVVQPRWEPGGLRYYDVLRNE